VSSTFVRVPASPTAGEAEEVGGAGAGAGAGAEAVEVGVGVGVGVRELTDLAIDLLPANLGGCFLTLRYGPEIGAPLGVLLQDAPIFKKIYLVPV